MTAPLNLIAAVAAAALLLLSAVLWMRYRRLLQRLRSFSERFEVQLARPAQPLAADLSAPARIREGFQRYYRALQATRLRIDRERARRAQFENGLTALEERFGLAIRGVEDAMWEWDLKTDRAVFSARWKALLGFAHYELSDRIDEWWERVHPDDHEAVLLEVKSHLQGETSRLVSEHRVRHKDGSWRWLLVRGSLVRDLIGEPSRIVGLVSDISARRRMQDAVAEIADSLCSLSGEACLDNLVRAFADALGVREAFVCECSDYPTTHVRMLARWKAGAFARCVEFDLTGTACEDVIHNGTTVFQAQGADERWPLEGQFERRSYLGIPCFDSAGRVIGHIACADDRPMREELPHQAILKIFAMRAAIEIERQQVERELGAEALRIGLVEFVTAREAAA